MEIVKVAKFYPSFYLNNLSVDILEFLLVLINLRCKRYA